MGARNTDFVAAEKAVTDAAGTELRGDPMFAGGTALVWHPDGPGDVKGFKVTIPEAGRRRLLVAFVQGEKAGSVSALVDGRAVPWAGPAPQAHLRVEGRTIIRLLALEPHDLSAGEHLLALRFEGSAPGAGRPEIVVDFLGVQKVDR